MQPLSSSVPNPHARAALWHPITLGEDKRDTRAHGGPWGSSPGLHEDSGEPGSPLGAQGQHCTRSTLHIPSLFPSWQRCPCGSGILHQDWAAQPDPLALAPEALPRANPGGRMLAGPVITGSMACYCSLCPGADKPL